MGKLGHRSISQKTKTLRLGSRLQVFVFSTPRQWTKKTWTAKINIVASINNHEND
jgi:hypothetical protein